MSSTPSNTKKNGFRESGDTPVDNDHPDDITLRNHRLAQYILANKGSYVPSPETLRKLGESATLPTETPDTLQERITELKKQHAKDLENLIKFQTAEYYQELIDHERCHDVSAYMDIDETYPDQVEFKKALQQLDNSVIRMDRFKRDMEDGISTLRYTHLKMLNSLRRTRNTLKARERQARQKRDARFPQSTQEYYKVTDRDVQLRVARFLTCSRSEQEKMMDEFGWAYRAVQPLLSLYKTDAKFSSDVNDTMNGLVVADPRRRRPFPLGQLAEEQAPSFTKFSPIS